MSLVWNAAGAMPVNTSWLLGATDKKGTWIYLDQTTGASLSAVSTDNGSTWVSGGTLPLGNPNAFITDCKGTWMAILGPGVAVSTNNGSSWSSAASIPWGSFGGAAATDGKGTWIVIESPGTASAVSTNNGASWAAGGALPSSENWEALATDGKGTWVAVAGANNTAVAVSTDNGATWVAGGALPVSAPWLAIATDGAGTWIATNNASTPGTAVSTNAGASWASGASLPSGTWYGLASDGRGGWVAASGSGTVFSLNAGSTWSAGTGAAAAPSRSVLTDGVGNWVAANNGTPDSFYASFNPYYAAPAAPTLQSPANASYDDVASGVTLSATYNASDAYGANAYALRVKTSAGSYNYWNASTSALQSTEVWNTLSPVVANGALVSVALPSGVLTDGNVYNWSFAMQESGNNLQGAFASDFTFTAQAAPTVTVTAPTGTLNGSLYPAITWTATFPSGATQTNYSVIVESGSYGTVPGSGTQAWSSGVIASSATTVDVTTALPANVTYRVFVQLTETGSETSPWAYSTFTLQADVPATPVLTATPGTDPTTGAPMVTLDLQCVDNQLTLNQASLESDVTTGWAAGTNTTIAASSTWAQDGSYSLSMTATAAGGVAANTPTGASGVACAPGETVRAMAFFHSPATARACTVEISFYNSAGTLLSSATSAAVNSTLSGNGGQAFVSAVAPASSATMSLTISGASLGASEILYADCMFLGPGSSTTWSAGGFVGSSTANLNFSDDGVNWFPVRNGTGLAIPAATQSVSVVDYEGALGFTRQYQAQVAAP